MEIALTAAILVITVVVVNLVLNRLAGARS